MCKYGKRLKAKKVGCEQKKTIAIVENCDHTNDDYLLTASKKEEMEKNLRRKFISSLE